MQWVLKWFTNCFYSQKIKLKRKYKDNCFHFLSLMSESGYEQIIIGWFFFAGGHIDVFI